MAIWLGECWLFSGNAVDGPHLPQNGESNLLRRDGRTHGPAEARIAQKIIDVLLVSSISTGGRVPL